MKKSLISIIFFVVFGLSLAGAQNLLDNDHQKAGQSYEKQAAAAMEAGDYGTAAKLSSQASTEYQLSQEFAANEVLRYRAANAISMAQEAIGNIENTADGRAAAATVSQAKALLKEAQALYAAASWVDSRTKAEASLQLIRSIKRTAAVQPKPPASGPTPPPAPQPPKAVIEAPPLPRYYVVREWAETKDCFWNIAGLTAVYGDPWRWEQLYQFNKPKMKTPDNPNLIYPGMIIEIPSLKDEKREGTYEAGKTYPAP